MPTPTPTLRLIPVLTSLAACASPVALQPAPVATDQVSGTTSLLIGISPVSESVVWGSGTNGTWVRSVDGGATWQHGTVPGAESLEFRDVHGVDASTAYVMSAGPSDSSRIYLTRDAGTTWSLQYTNPDSAGFFDCMDFWDSEHGLLLGDPVDGEMVILSTVDGTNWTRIAPERLPPALPTEMGLAASGTCVLTRSNGRAWVALGLPLARLLSTSDFGASWVIDTLPIPAMGSVTFRDDRVGMAFGGGAGPGTAVTFDGGVTWEARTNPFAEKGIHGGVFVPGTAEAVVVGVSPEGLAWSPDHGATWTMINANNYWSVAFASERVGWAVGSGGRITKLTGFGTR